MSAFSRLRLHDFRNYEALDLHLDPRPVCLLGKNGAGKTNLLEAISQFSPGRGLRRAALGDMTRHAQSKWVISAQIDGHTAGIALEPSPSGHTSKRVVRVEGVPARASDLIDIVRIVWLIPAMDRVFAGPASERRRFLDRLVLNHFPSHAAAATQYEKTMRERNALLERPFVDAAWAEALETRMADAGAQMAVARAKTLEKLQESINSRPEGAFPKADLSLKGLAEEAAMTGAPLQSVADILAEALQEGRRRDKAAGRCLSGPHRADLHVIHRPTEMPAQNASTGQQKALLVGLILASARALQEERGGKPPILLLDEAAAHLDADRRAALYEELLALGGQAWLTGTEHHLFSAFENKAQYFNVENGQISLYLP